MEPFITYTETYKTTIGRDPIVLARFVGALLGRIKGIRSLLITPDEVTLVVTLIRSFKHAQETTSEAMAIIRMHPVENSPGSSNVLN